MDGPPADGCELLTSPGPAAMAIILAWGPRVRDFASRHLRMAGSLCSVGDEKAGAIRRAALLGDDGAVLDDILVSIHSTGQAPQLRLHLHGNPALVRWCLGLLAASGIPATSTQATTQPDLWPAADLIEAEIWHALPTMLTLRGAEWMMGQVAALRAAVGVLLEEPDQGMASESCRQIAKRRQVAEWFARPLSVAVVGPTNAGKSTLVNALSDRLASMVSPAPGTTRDWVEVPGEVQGFPVLWIDTAGWRVGGDELDAAGMARTRAVVERSDMTVLVADATAHDNRFVGEFAAEFGGLEPTVIALNKVDLLPGTTPDTGRRLPGLERWPQRCVAVSAVRGTGFEGLISSVLSSAGRNDAALESPAAVTAGLAATFTLASEASDRNQLRRGLLQLLRRRGSAAE